MLDPPRLGWILDLYGSVDEIRSYGQTIVYTVHESVGHLGIFVSGSVAKKQHDEFSSNIDLIDTLPPGLDEAVFERKTGDTASHELVSGNWVMRCEMRTLDDIRALGGNDQADERRFATVFLSMSRIEARCRNASAFRLRFSQSLTSLRQRLRQALNSQSPRLASRTSLLPHQLRHPCQRQVPQSPKVSWTKTF